MQKDESRNDLGIVRIHDNVIASISSLAAMEIPGVKGIGKNLRSGLMELIDGKNTATIKIIKDKNGDISIDIPLIIKYGFNIPDVASKVQENIRNNLEKMTNISIKDININAQGIERG